MESTVLVLISIVGVVAFAVGYTLGRRHKEEPNNG